jgi:hypothetical protein
MTSKLIAHKRKIQGFWAIIASLATLSYFDEQGNDQTTV